MTSERFIHGQNQLPVDVYRGLSQTLNGVKVLQRLHIREFLNISHLDELGRKPLRSPPQRQAVTQMVTRAAIPATLTKALP